MTDIHKIIKIQGNLLDSMLIVSDRIKYDLERGFSFASGAESETEELLKLAIIFEKIQPKYIDLSLNGKE